MIMTNHSIDADAVELAKELDGLPLALSTAGAYLNNVAASFIEYLRMYRESWARLQKTTPTLLSYDRALYSTWAISYTQVQRQSPTSAILLRLWAYFDNDDLWFELLREGHSGGPQWFRELTEDMIRFNTVVRVLSDYGLVDVNTTSREGEAGSRGYSMHGCVHSWTRHVLNEVLDIDMARLAMRCVGLHVPHDTERGYWLVQRRLILHAARCRTMIVDRLSTVEGDELILHHLGDLFLDQGWHSDAEAMYERALRGYEKAWGPEHTSTLNTVNNLGILYKNQGRLSDAEAMYERALRGKEKAWGLEHTSTLDTVNNLGNLYADQGRLSDAEAMYERALQGYEKAISHDQVDTYIPALNTIQNFAILRAERGRVSEARALYLRCQAGLKVVFGVQHDRYREVTSALESLNTAGNVV